MTFRYERYVMENVTRGMIRSGWKGYSDSFDPWMGNYGQFDSDYFGFDPDFKLKETGNSNSESNNNNKDKTNVNSSSTFTGNESYVNKDEETGGFYMKQSQEVINLWLRLGVYEEREGKYYEKGTLKEIKPY